MTFRYILLTYETEVQIFGKSTERGAQDVFVRSMCDYVEWRQIVMYEYRSRPIVRARNSALQRHASLRRTQYSLGGLNYEQAMLESSL